uniref:Uncharacterized protein n=1 Tax=Micrurus corallinus TaxID=54390 RepID=A0A2D4GYK4_MICCO
METKQIILKFDFFKEVSAGKDCIGQASMGKPVSQDCATCDRMICCCGVSLCVCVFNACGKQHLEEACLGLFVNLLVFHACTRTLLSQENMSPWSLEGVKDSQPEDDTSTLVVL